MRIAQIQNNVVVNIIEAESVWDSSPNTTYMATDTAGPGWILVDGELQVAPIDYISLAEAFVEKYFSTTRLLQCKVWFDLLPHTSTPKLLSLFQWTATVTGMAMQSSANFPVPPVTFFDVAQECVPQVTQPQ